MWDETSHSLPTSGLCPCKAAVNDVEEHEKEQQQQTRQQQTKQSDKQKKTKEAKKVHEEKIHQEIKKQTHSGHDYRRTS